MIIEALKHRYYIIHKEEETKGYEVFCCREYVDAQHDAYDVYRIKKTLLIQKLILELTNKEKEEHFSDLYEYFSKDGELYLVLIHKEGIPLEEKIKEDADSLKERMQIGKNLLEQILLLSIPDYILAGLWKENRILVDQGLAISFRYRLEGILLTEEERRIQIRDGLSDLFTKLFDKEMELKKCSKLPEFIKNLREEKIVSLWEIYQEYHQLCEILEELEKRGNLRPNTILFRIWDKIKKGFPYMEKMAVILILLLICYFVYAILYPSNTVECLKYETIGTLMIEEIPDGE